MKKKKKKGLSAGLLAWQAKQKQLKAAKAMPRSPKAKKAKTPKANKAKRQTQPKAFPSRKAPTKQRTAATTETRQNKQRYLW